MEKKKRFNLQAPPVYDRTVTNLFFFHNYFFHIYCFFHNSVGDCMSIDSPTELWKKKIIMEKIIMEKKKVRNFSIIDKLVGNRQSHLLDQNGLFLGFDLLPACSLRNDGRSPALSLIHAGNLRPGHRYRTSGGQ
jgi:hypothetical protein